MAKSFGSYILDTSAFISLESIGFLSKVLQVFSVTTTNSVIKELEAFAKHDDTYGKIAKEILKRISEFTVESCEITESIKYIEPTDNELYNLALKKNIPLITDETKLVHHAREKIEVYFTPVFLVLSIEMKQISKKEALDKLENLKNRRNWGNNIIYLVFKDQIEKL